MELTQEQKSIIREVFSDAVGTTNYLTDINKEYNLDMWDEIIDYFKEKRDYDQNHKPNKPSKGGLKNG
mgnify:CR=1 FL=1